MKNNDLVRSARLALTAIVGPVILTLAWIVLGLLRPPVANEYGVQGGIQGMLTSPISGLGVGPNALLFNAAFVISGVAIILGTLGTFRVLKLREGVEGGRWPAVLLALSPLGFIVVGIFTLAVSDPIHLFGFFLGAGTPIISFIVAGRFFKQLPSWERFANRLMLGSLFVLLLVIWFFAAFDEAVIAAGQGVAGIPSRLLVLVIGAYYAAMGWKAYRMTR